MRFLFALIFLAGAAAAQWDEALRRPILDPKQPLLEVQVYTAAKVPPLPVFKTAAEARQYYSSLRKRLLDEVYFRGEARKWRDAPLRVEWMQTIRGGSDYEIRKLRVEAVPGLWVAGLLYRPLKIAGRVPAVLNVNGHEKEGVSTGYIQERCIHLARNGLLALNLEWLGRGQLTSAGMDHTRMPQIDLTGTSGVGVFFLAMRKGLDILETLPETDRARIAVTGLSGGGWQTITLSSLDERVAASSPLAGYSSFVTRAQWPELDLGDAEQTPSDLASVADYSHLTAMLAPRWLQVANNAKDNCCFRADYALGPLVQAARTTFNVLGVPERLRYHINFGAGHNYDRDNREAFYRLLGDAFFAGKGFPVEEKPLESPVKSAAELRVELPEGNLDFNSLALKLATGLPRAGSPKTRERLRAVVRAKDYSVDARPAGTAGGGGRQARFWQLKMDRTWSVPAVEITPDGASTSAIVLADAGRSAAAPAIRALLDSGVRVLAVDPFYFGESKIATRDWLYAILVASLGDRPIGLQASQIAAAARWLKQQTGGRPVSVVASGPRTSLVALIAAALEPKAIDEARLSGAYGSLQEILKQSLGVDRAPELFCFGLLEAFDMRDIAALARSVKGIR